MFTSEEAFDARDAGESIMLSLDEVHAVIEHHSLDADEFLAARGGSWHIDAAEVLDWLGY